MASIASEIKTYLKTKTAVTDIIGTGDNAKIYLQQARQNVTVPYIVIQTNDGDSYEHLGGISGTAQNRVQINCYESTEALAYTLAEAVRLAPLQMFRGTVGSTFVEGVTSPYGYTTIAYFPKSNSDQREYFIARDYFVTYSEATS